MPVFGKRFCKSWVKASKPPADAPIATTVNAFAAFGVLEILSGCRFIFAAGTFCLGPLFYWGDNFTGIALLETDFLLTGVSLAFIFTGILN